MADITTEYRGFTIQFYEGSTKEDETWSCELGHNKHDRCSFHDMKKRIDQFIKDESEYTNRECLVQSYMSEKISPAVITSEDKGGKDVWVRYGDKQEISGRREKKAKGNVYCKTPKNQEILKEIQARDDQIRRLRAEKEVLFNGLERIFPEEDDA